MKNKSLFYLLLSIAAFFFACVPARQFDDMKAKAERCEEDNTAFRKQNQELTASNAELESQLKENKKALGQLKNDTADIGRTLRQITGNYEKLNKTYELLLQKNKELLSGNEAENKKLMGNLQRTQETLQQREDELKKLGLELSKQKQGLDATKNELDKTQAELKMREQRVAELEAVLKQKEDAVSELKKKVSAALIGFEGKGLTVSQKNGKIYVSLDENLLFASGSIVVEEKGAEAIKKIAKVLEQNQEINIMVEGHTDDIPMKGKGEIKDNWDLSVMRATAIVKIITQNSSTDPKRLSAAGRAEYFPIDPSKNPEARKKNRRTEIILTPKLDELLKVLENN